MLRDNLKPKIIPKSTYATETLKESKYLGKYEWQYNLLGFRKDRNSSVSYEYNSCTLCSYTFPRSTGRSVKTLWVYCRGYFIVGDWSRSSFLIFETTVHVVTNHFVMTVIYSTRHLLTETKATAKKSIIYDLPVIQLSLGGFTSLAYL